jgi:putative ABC transport system ATP-binding protein
MIRVTDLEFRYPQGPFQLRVPRLDVERGETVAFVGPSGSGKTTLLNLVAGIVTPERGEIESGGTNVTSLGDQRRREFRARNVGLVFQEFELLDYLSVLDNILLPYRISSALTLDAVVRDRAVSLARRVGLEDKLRRYPGKLSQGERQRVAVCRAVLPGPPLILADEPTGNLDPVNAGLVLDLLLELAAESNATLLTVTHDHGLLPRFQRIIDIKQLSEPAS